MAAGGIYFAFPDPTGGSLVVPDPAALPRPPSLGASWEQSAKELADTFRSGSSGGADLAQSIKAGRSPFGSAVRSAARGVAGVLLSRLLAKAVVKFVSTALQQNDIPEIAHLNRSMGLIAGRVASAIEENMGALTTAARVVVASILPVRHVATIGPAAGMLLLRSAEFAVVAIGRRVLTFADAKVVTRIAAQATTAGLETGGLAVTAPPIPGAGARIPGLPDVAIGIPGGLTFTGPVNIMAGESRDEVIETTRGELVAEALGAAALIRPEFLAVKVALEASRKWAADAGAELAALEQDRLQAAGAAAEILRARIAGILPSAEDDASPEATAAMTKRGDALIVAAPFWERISAEAGNVSASLEGFVGGSLHALAESTRKFSINSAGEVTSALSPTGEALDGLNDALSLDLALIDKATSGSVRAQRVQRVLAMQMMLATAFVQGGIAFARAVAEAAAGDEAEAALHFAAAALYGGAAGLAIAGGASGGRPRFDAVTTPDQLGTVASLAVVVPGISDPARIRDEIARAITSGRKGEGTQSYAGRPSRKFDAKTIAAAARLNTSGGLKIGQNQPGGFAFLGIVALALDFGDEISGAAHRAGRELRRFGKKLGF